MFSGEKNAAFDGTFLLTALLAWTVSACMLLLPAALIANLARLGERGLGYLSSGLSFAAAAISALAAARRRRAGGLSTALLTGSALVIALLSVGFLIEGEKMDPSAVLSLVSFTYAGCLVGSLILYSPRRKNRSSALRVGA